MKNTQAYIAAIPVALFIVIESVAVLLFVLAPGDFSR